MLSRPEVGSWEHIKLWLAAQPADASYDWDRPSECACAQYSAAHLGDKTAWVRVRKLGGPIERLNWLAEPFPHTFGALYQRACESDKSKALKPTSYGDSSETMRDVQAFCDGPDRQDEQ